MRRDPRPHNSASIPHLGRDFSRGCRRGHIQAFVSLPDDVIDDGFHIVGLLENGELPISAGAFAHDPFDVFHLALAAKLVDFGGDELQQLIEQRARLDFCFAAEIDQLAFDAVTRRAPPVLVDQASPFGSESGASAASSNVWDSDGDA